MRFNSERGYHKLPSGVRFYVLSKLEKLHRASHSKKVSIKFMASKVSPPILLVEKFRLPGDSHRKYK